MHFDADELRAALASLPCRHCGHVGATATIAGSGDHFAAIRCDGCHAQLEWLGWPPTPERRERRRTARRAAELTRLGADHCELCLRARFDLSPPDTLEIHHVDEDRDNNALDNLRLYCTACHRLVHWLRTYLGRAAAA